MTACAQEVLSHSLYSLLHPFNNSIITGFLSSGNAEQQPLPVEGSSKKNTGHKVPVFSIDKKMPG